MNKKDQTSLLTLMESGILSELKHKQRRTTQLTWVFASCNSTNKLLSPLITRFSEKFENCDLEDQINYLWCPRPQFQYNLKQIPWRTHLYHFTCRFYTVPCLSTLVNEMIISLPPLSSLSLILLVEFLEVDRILLSRFP
jgi:hypothetical protein